MTNNNWAGQYQSIALDGVQFPCEEVNIVFNQRVKAHPKPNVPGAKVESLAPYPHTFHIKNALFINGLMPSTGENWDTANMFPKTFNQIFNILTDAQNNIVTFTHPTLGDFNVKCVGGNSLTTYDCKNGQMMDFQLIQANTEAQDPTSNVDSSTNAMQSASVFDAIVIPSSINPNLLSIPNIGITIPKPPNFMTLRGLFGKVLQSINAITYLVNTPLRLLNSIVSQARSIIKALKSSLDALKAAFTAILHFHLDNVLSAINDIFNRKMISLTTIKKYFTPTVMTPAQVANATNNTIEQLIQLNDGITQRATFPAGYLVLYYHVGVISVG